jgi:hypothetical protein
MRRGEQLVVWGLLGVLGAGCVMMIKPLVVAGLGLSLMYAAAAIRGGG